MGNWDAEATLLLVVRALRLWDVLSIPDLMYEIEGAAVDPGEVHKALAVGLRSGLLLEGADGWRLADHGPAQPPQERRRMTPVTAGIYADGEIVHALLPKGAEFCVRTMLTRHGSGTLSDIHEHLVGSGWTGIPEDELILWLAYFEDFNVSEGLWSLEEDGANGPRLRDAEPLHARVRAAAQQKPSDLPWQGTARMGLPMSLTAPGRREARENRRVRRTGKLFTLHFDEVLVTLRGDAFHLDEECRLLRMGWAKTFEDGKRPTGLRVVRTATALKDGRHACTGCT